MNSKKLKSKSAIRFSQFCPYIQNELPLNTLCRKMGTVETVVIDYTINDLIEEYLARHDTTMPVRDGRAVGLDLRNNVISRLPGTDYQFH